MERARIERRTMIDRPIASAWLRVVDDFARWFGDDARLDPRPGGTVSSGGRVGHVTVLDHGRRIVWEWSFDGDPGWTEVQIRLTPAGPETRVEVTETLHEWEHERYDALDGGGPGPFGVVGVTV